MVVCKFQGLGPDAEGGALVQAGPDAEGGVLVQAGPAGVLRPGLTALVFCHRREAPAAVSELREGRAGTPREGAQSLSAVPGPVPRGPRHPRTLPYPLNP